MEAAEGLRCVCRGGPSHLRRVPPSLPRQGRAGHRGSGEAAPPLGEPCLPPGPPQLLLYLLLPLQTISCPT